MNYQEQLSALKLDAIRIAAEVAKSRCPNKMCFHCDRVATWHSNVLLDVDYAFHSDVGMPVDWETLRAKAEYVCDGCGKVMATLAVLTKWRLPREMLKFHCPVAGVEYVAACYWVGDITNINAAIDGWNPSDPEADEPVVVQA